MSSLRAFPFLFCGQTVTLTTGNRQVRWSYPNGAERSRLLQRSDRLLEAAKGGPDAWSGPIAAFPFARQGALLPTWQAPLACPLHAAVSHFQTMLHCQRRPRQPPTAHSRVRPRNLTLSPPLPFRSLTVAPLQSLQRCDGETTERQCGDSGETMEMSGKPTAGSGRPEWRAADT